MFNNINDGKRNLEKLIQLDVWPVRSVLDILLQDKTTKKNIIFATDSYAEFGKDFQEKREMTAANLLGMDVCKIQPRVVKSMEHQAVRTKKKAEVFTPAWICCKMINFLDEEWFGYPDVFNHMDDREWIVNGSPVIFPDPLTWKAYIDSTRIEITCGEAPFLVSRYDAATGEKIALSNRIGLLDRKLRIVNENAQDEASWLHWVIRAFRSIYGYEYQGDNLLIGRINLLMTFVEYFQARWQNVPDDRMLTKIADIISWNLWQMDGLTGMVPLLEREAEQQQMSLLGLPGGKGFGSLPEKEKIPCRIYDWGENKEIFYNDIKLNK